MKKLIFSAVFCGLVITGFSQSIKKVNNYLDKNEIEKAKSEIDGFLAKKPDDPEGNYLKAKIYEKIADSAAIRSLVEGNAREQALEAFKKAVVDTNDSKMKLLMMKDNYSPIFNMYSGYYGDAAEAFNEAAGSQNKEGFAKAMNLFMKANDIGQMIREYGWANIPEVDTTLVLNIGKAAINAGDDKVAEDIFKKLAEAKVAGENDESFLIPYQWLTLHYKNAGDTANMMKYAELGREVFPTNDYFDLVLMDFYREKKDMPSLFSRYEQLVTRNPDSLNYHFNYANELFGYIYNSDEGVEVKNKDQYLKDLKSELDKAYGIDANDVNTNWLYSQYYYNEGIGLRDQAAKEKDATKKQALTDEAKENWNKAIPYAEKAMSVLNETHKSSDKSRYKSIANLMQNIYQSLGDKENLKKYQDIYDNADQNFQ